MSAVTSTWRLRLNAALADGLERLGWQGVAGVLLVGAAITAHFVLLKPEMARAGVLRAELTRLAKRPPQPAAAPADSPRAQMTEFYRLFPPSNRASQVLQKIVDAAEREGLKLEQGEYRVVRDPGGELVQMHITLPVKGSYTQVRKFIAAALAAAPSLALQGVQMERDKIGDSAIEARVHLLAFMREER
jgi:hypothetical protein